MTDLRVYLTADGGSVAASRDGAVVADGSLHRTPRAVELRIRTEAETATDVDAMSAVLVRLGELAALTGDAPLRWLVSDPTTAHDAAADAAGLPLRRDVLQLRRPLPVEAEHRAERPVVAVRAFRVGEDEDAWLVVNNRAFAGHPDQAGQTRADLDALEHEPWFDPTGFLLLPGERPGSLLGFCWTKVHAAADPVLGEIFVIGVDPDAHGRGLGPALTIAGLDHLAARGIGTGMLYVDVANAGAVRMYERLGFTRHHVDRIYSA